MFNKIYCIKRVKLYCLLLVSLPAIDYISVSIPLLLALMFSNIVRSLNLSVVVPVHKEVGNVGGILKQVEAHNLANELILGCWVHQWHT